MKIYPDHQEIIMRAYSALAADDFGAAMKLACESIVMLAAFAEDEDAALTKMIEAIQESWKVDKDTILKCVDEALEAVQ